MGPLLTLYALASQCSAVKRERAGWLGRARPVGMIIVCPAIR